MLIRFSVKNFLSFGVADENKAEEFSMIAGKLRSKNNHIFEDDKLKILKFASIYGANASGKSNFVKALAFYQKCAITGFPEDYSNSFCKMIEDGKNQKSYFESEIKIDSKYYAYGFEAFLNQGSFTSEWLIELSPNGTEKNIFIRDVESKTYEVCSSFGKNLKSKLNGYLDDMKDDDSALFLTAMNQNKKSFYESFLDAKIIRDVFLWIKNGLDINYPDQPISDFSYLSDESNVDEILHLISAFGTGINSFKMLEIDKEDVMSKLPIEIRKDISSKIERIHKKDNEDRKKKVRIIIRSHTDFFIIEADENGTNCHTLKFIHGDNENLFDLGDESDGTIRLLDLIEVLLSKKDKTFVIDELDRCLHPCLTYKFVEEFLSRESNNNIQLIVTTHESRLLDFDLLRRDEIWFVNKNDTGISRIYSLDEYNTRFDQIIDKAYLDGRYGGVPVFSTVFPLKG